MMNLSEQRALAVLCQGGLFPGLSCSDLGLSLGWVFK